MATSTYAAFKGAAPLAPRLRRLEDLPLQALRRTASGEIGQPPCRLHQHHDRWPRRRPRGQRHHHHHGPPNAVQPVSSQHNRRPRFLYFRVSGRVEIYPPDRPADNDRRRRGHWPRAHLSRADPAQACPSNHRVAASHSAISSLRAVSCSTAKAARYSGSLSPSAAGRACSYNCRTNALRSRAGTLCLKRRTRSSGRRRRSCSVAMIANP